LRPNRASFSPEVQPGRDVSSGGRKPTDGTGIVSRRRQMQGIQPSSFPDVEASDYIPGGGLSPEVALMPSVAAGQGNGAGREEAGHQWRQRLS